MRAHPIAIRLDDGGSNLGNNRGTPQRHAVITQPGDQDVVGEGFMLSKVFEIVQWNERLVIVAEFIDTDIAESNDPRALGTVVS